MNAAAVEEAAYTVVMGNASFDPYLLQLPHHQIVFLQSQIVPQFVDIGHPHFLPVGGAVVAGVVPDVLQKEQYLQRCAFNPER